MWIFSIPDLIWPWIGHHHFPHHWIQPPKSQMKTTFDESWWIFKIDAICFSFDHFHIKRMLFMLSDAARVSMVTTL